MIEYNLDIPISGSEYITNKSIVEVDLSRNRCCVVSRWHFEENDLLYKTDGIICDLVLEAASDFLQFVRFFQAASKPLTSI